MSRYCILALDGGGIRGVLSLVLLERLERAVPGWLGRAALLAGTSTGGIIALGLAHGMSVGELRALYEEHGAEIFDDSWLDNLKDLGQTIGAQYHNRGLTRLVTRLFGDITLGDLPRHVLIPAFDLDNEHPDPARRRWSPKFFHNIPGTDCDADALVRKVALYTSAAPTYFPSVDGFIDGGVVANNPSMAALAQSQDRRAEHTPPLLDDVVLLSIGTGTSLMRIAKSRLDWGRAQWAGPLVQIMLDGVMGVADYQCQQMLGARYHRLAPVFPPDQVVGLDAVAQVPEIVACAHAVALDGTAQWLQEMWQ